jgi:hypothetical protein
MISRPQRNDCCSQSWELDLLGPRIFFVVSPTLKILDYAGIDSRQAHFVERHARGRGNYRRDKHTNSECRRRYHSPAKVYADLASQRPAWNSCQNLHDRLPGFSEFQLAPIPFLQFLTASRVARCAPREEKQPLAEGIKRGGACLSAHNRSSFPASRPEPPTGVLASGDRVRRFRREN